MVIFPSNAKQIIAIIARIIKLLRWYNWGVLQFFDISNFIKCEILLAPFHKCHWFAFIIRVCEYVYVYVWMCCVYCVKNALISFKKSANKIYHEKIRQKFWVL